MSVVACRILDNGYEIAADSIGTRGWTQSRGANKKLSKLTEANNLVIGGSGLVEEVSLFTLYCQTRQPAAADYSSIVSFVSEYSDWKRKKIDKPLDGTTEYLFGIDGKVFHIYSYEVIEITKYEAIGAGMDFALAALWLGKTAEEAVGCAIELSTFCEGPVRVIRKTK